MSSKMKKLMTMAMIATILLTSVVLLNAEPYSWQIPQAKVEADGNLVWSPTEYEFQKGSAVRYIDYEAGEDNNDGASKDAPWKHHPWDANATGKAAGASGPITYVFKGGVTYRGFLEADDSGSAGEPVRLTRD
ncbi:MAG: hypothetical protein ACLFQ6_01840, partial [Candidatus Sumerlaeia bacterium]